MNGIIKVLMRRDGLTLEEATEMFNELQDRFITHGENPDILLHEIGLEPDYIFELLPF